MDEPSVELLAKYQAGDEQAATELFRRYVSRLTVLARARIAPRIARRFDAEDVVLSAYRSFFVRARDGQFSLTRSGDLWRLLVGIMLRKLYHQAARHTADKRSVDREQPLPSGGESAWEAIAPAITKPTAEEAVAMAELVETFMAQLEPGSRQVVELRLQDYRIAEIAAATHRSERTVRRILEELRHRLRSSLGDAGDKLGGLPAARCRSAEPASEIDDSESAAGLAVDGADRRSGPSPENPSVASAASTSPPEFLSDRDFLLQLHLGTGGTGRVYRALPRGGSTPVAVKMLKKASQTDPAAVARFLDEARTVSRLNHPGIVGVHGIGRTRAGGYFLVQELVPGESLAQVAASGQIEPGDVVRWIADAAEAIEYSHRQHVIHCDLKPANLLLDAQGRVRVADFGLAQIVAPWMRSRAAIAGTAGYMAPEQLDPAWGPIGPRTDVFGLGAVLFALLAGRPPFTGKTIDDLLKSMLEGAPGLSLRRDRPDVPEEIDVICRKCMAVAPRDRFATAAALAQALLLTM
ncbi:MAG: protein kinase domain-containing protein [Deltaproteobacteria bacterium]